MISSYLYKEESQRLESLLIADQVQTERGSNMLSRFAVSGSVLRCTKCQVSSLIFFVLKMGGNLLLQVQGRALLTTKPSPNEGGGLKGILGRFFARRQVPLKTPFLLLHISPDDFGNANLASDRQDRAYCSI